MWCGCTFSCFCSFASSTSRMKNNPPATWNGSTRDRYHIIVSQWNIMKNIIKYTYIIDILDSGASGQENPPKKNRHPDISWFYPSPTYCCSPIRRPSSWGALVYFTSPGFIMCDFPQLEFPSHQSRSTKKKKNPHANPPIQAILAIQPQDLEWATVARHVWWLSLLSDDPVGGSPVVRKSLKPLKKSFQKERTCKFDKKVPWKRCQLR